jgi:predicted membrane channel-forming protein YqfA (hemolysin III family)
MPRSPLAYIGVILVLVGIVFSALGGFKWQTMDIVGYILMGFGVLLVLVGASQAPREPRE